MFYLFQSFPRLLLIGLALGRLHHLLQNTSVSPCIRTVIALLCVCLNTFIKIIYWNFRMLCSFGIKMRENCKGLLVRIVCWLWLSYPLGFWKSIKLKQPLIPCTGVYHIKSISISCVGNISIMAVIRTELNHLYSNGAWSAWKIVL